jgi:hypothetical protein
LDSFSELTVHLGLSLAREGGPGHDHEIEPAARRPLEPAEALAEEPAGPVSPDGAPDPAAHRQAEAIEGPAVGHRDQQEQPPVEACASLEDRVELGPGPQALAGPEAHR